MCRILIKKAGKFVDFETLTSEEKVAKQRKEKAG